jgi:hypothetical protein
MKCKHITEFGVRSGNSTSALAMSYPDKLVCYDINPIYYDLNDLLKSELISFKFIQKNVLDIEIEETDLLFIDTFHTYKQLKKELQLHKNKVRKYIILHDTKTFGSVGEDGTTPGLEQAANEELSGFHLEQFFENNNGLSIYRKL